MEKIININFQGRVIAIEESAYEILKQYSDSLRRHFANEEGSEEIISDIENRVAELLANKLKNASCINTSDINAIIDSIGHIEDIEAAEAEDAGKSKTGAQPHIADTITDNRFYRSADDKIIAGVCSGIGRRMNVDPLIIRILFVLFFGALLWIYLLLWLIVPAHSNGGAKVVRRLFRDPDSKVIAGVCGGLAHYFDTEAWKVRIVFMLPIILSAAFNSIRVFAILRGMHDHFITGYFGSSLFILYVILWIAVPYATLPTDKMEMRGERVDINSIKAASQARAGYMPPPQPRNSGLGRVLGILLKAFILFVGGSVALSLFCALIGMLFALPVVTPLTDFGFHNATESMLAYIGVILTMAVPFIALLVFLLRRMMKIRSRRHYLGFVFAILWVAGIVCAVVTAGMIIGDHRYTVKNTDVVSIKQPATGKMYVTMSGDRPLGRTILHNGRWGFWDEEDDEDMPFRLVNNNQMWLELVKVHIAESNDSLYHVYVDKACRSASESVGNSVLSHITYTVSQQDSIISIPRGFMIDSKDKFCGQVVTVTVEVPYGRNIQLSKGVREYYWRDRNARGWRGRHHIYNRPYDDDDSKDRTYIMTVSGMRNINDTSAHNGDDNDDDE